MSEKYPRCEVEHARNIIKQGHFERAKNVLIYGFMTSLQLSLLIKL